jgi:hypothetical protein
MKRLIAIGVASLLVAAAPVGWTLYGSSTLGREELRSVFGDVVLMPNGHLRISTEDVTLEGFNVARQNDPDARRGNAKLATGYRPPLATLGPLGHVALLDAIELEELTNSGLLKPRTQAVRELDCAGKRSRTLSVVEDGIEIDTSKLNLSWQNILPGTSGANLLRLACH